MHRLLEALGPRESLLEAAKHETSPRDPHTALACHQLEMILSEAEETLLDLVTEEDCPIQIVWRVPDGFAFRDEYSSEVEAWIEAPYAPIDNDCWSVHLTKPMYRSLVD